jgi:hypothetical protein
MTQESAPYSIGKTAEVIVRNRFRLPFRLGSAGGCPDRLLMQKGKIMKLTDAFTWSGRPEANSASLPVQFTIVLLLLLPTVAQSADTAQQIASLFKSGWDASQTDSVTLKTKNYEKAKEQYRQAKIEAPDDPRVDYAMAIVAALTNRFKESAKYLDDAPRPYDPPLFIRRLQVWLQINRGDAVAAQASAAKLAHDLGANTSAKNPLEKQEIANWLGRVLGYYSGPALNPLKSADLAKLDAELSASLTGPLAAACSEGQAAVAERYSNLKSELESAQKAVKEKNEKDRQATQDKLTAQQNLSSADLDAATAQKDSAWQAAQQSLKKRNIDGPRLKRQIGDLQQSFKSANWNLNSMQNDLRNEQAKAPKDQDTKKINSLNSRIHDEEKRLNDYRNNLSNQMATVNAQLTANDDNLRAADLQFNQTKQDYEAKLKAKNKTDRDMKTFVSKSKEPVSDSDDNTKKLQQKLTSIESYAPIDFAKNRDRILNNFPQVQLSSSTK